MRNMLMVLVLLTLLGIACSSRVSGSNASVTENPIPTDPSEHINVSVCVWHSDNALPEKKLQEIFTEDLVAVSARFTSLGIAFSLAVFEKNPLTSFGAEKTFVVDGSSAEAINADLKEAIDKEIRSYREHLQRTNRNELCDVILLVTSAMGVYYDPQQGQVRGRFAGVASPRENGALILAYPAHPLRRHQPASHTIQHELGHLFGAQHPPSYSLGVMDIGCLSWLSSDDEDCYAWDENNAAIIMQNRGKFLESPDEATALQ